MSEPVTCPLCDDEIPASELVESAPPELFEEADLEEALAAIMEAHPDWIEEDGACTRCWEEYAQG
jgi:hypothetical protein